SHPSPFKEVLHEFTRSDHGRSRMELLMEAPHLSSLAALDDRELVERGEFIERKAAEFARLAPRFELVSWLFAFGRLTRLRRATAALARTDGVALHALDLCCGTGGLTRALLQLFPRVTGIELSAVMLRVAGDRCARQRG